MVDGVEKISSAQEGMADALSAHWMPTFEARATSPTDRRFLLQRFAVPVGPVKFPCKADMAAVVAGTKEKAPGPDGLPPRCLSATPDAADEADTSSPR